MAGINAMLSSEYQIAYIGVNGGPDFNVAPIDTTTMSVLTNSEVIAIDQDGGACVGKPILTNGPTCIWLKPLGSPSGPNYAVLLWNVSSGSSDVTRSEVVYPAGANVTYTELTNGVKYLWLPGPHETRLTATNGYTLTSPGSFVAPPGGVVTVPGTAVGDTVTWKILWAGQPYTISFSLTNIPNARGNVYYAKDLWSGEEQLFTNTLTATCIEAESKLFRISPNGGW